VIDADSASGAESSEISVSVGGMVSFTTKMSLSSSGLRTSDFQKLHFSPRYAGERQGEGWKGDWCVVHDKYRH
jgi:hypothetical protein